MAKQLNVDMSIRANTSQAQTELKKLQQTLNEAINGTIQQSGNMPLTKEISEATQAAAKLKVALAEATNVNTGNLDLSKFSESLAKSKISLKEYSNQLLNLGPSGEKAFMQMAKAISSAEIPLKRSNGLLSNLWTTMKNTARWQLSSSAIKGFTGAIAGAYNYAQDLNKSLNNIRIVTGQNTDQMAKFATEANKAAQSLSTTTIAYTDAALIYYQQGLSDEAVQKRTETTIKLANVSRQSAEQVSSQMTAIWNNFAKGSENLEYYADVITALGASTASSSEEIAEGLSKFAAVADTVGLSYEKASAALATVVAETRQSADVVGTAFKTIFARMEGLNLGETLEDGTTLNKYSEALEKVGVNIKNQSGELKSMDTILDNIGAKWETLNKDQQIALAQTVAGVRQYTQFIALMDNYKDVQKNQGIAEDSSGTIQKQADIYAESWEASSKRVKAAAQGLYEQLLNDEFFIKFNDLLTGLINGVGKFIKTLGGVPGVLGLLGTVATTVFKDQIALSIDNLVYKLSVFTGVAQDSAKKMQNEIVDAVNGIANPADLSDTQKIENTVLVDSIKLSQELANKKDQLLESDQKHLQTLIDITNEYGKQAIAATKVAEEADEQEGAALGKFQDNYIDDQITKNDFVKTGKLDEDIAAEAEKTSSDVAEAIKKVVTEVEAGKQAVDAFYQALNSPEGLTTDTYEQIYKNFDMIKDVGGNIPEIFQDCTTSIDHYGMAAKKVTKIEEEFNIAQQKVKTLLKQGKKGSKEYEDAVKDQEKAETKLVRAKKILKNTEDKLNFSLKKSGKNIKDVKKAVDNATKAHNKLNQTVAKTGREAAGENKDLAKNTKGMKEYGKAVADNIDKKNKDIIANQNYKKSVEGTENALAKAKKEMMTSFGQGLTTTFRGVSQLTMGISSLKGMFDVLNDTEMSFGEKFLSVATSMSMAIPSLISGFQSLSKGLSTIKAGFISGAQALAIHIGALEADEVAEKKLTLADIASKINKKLKTASTTEDTVATEANTVAEGVNAGAKGGSTLATIAQTIANWALLASMPPLLAITLVFIAALAALVAIALIVVSVVNAITKANNADAEAAKNAEEAAENLAEAYNQCKEEYEKLKESISDHQSALEAIESLTKGTREWKDAIREANEKARELIESYHLIKDKDYTIDSDGIIRFNEGVKDRLVNEKADELAGKEAASIIAKQIAKKARAKSDLTDLKKREHADYNFGTFLGDVFTGGMVGKAQTASDIQSDKTINNAISRLTEGDLAEDFKLGNITSDELAEKLDIDDEDLIKSITDLATTINENTEAEKQSYQLATEALVSENEEVQKSEYKEELTNASGRIYEQYEKEAAENAKSAIKDRGDFLWWNWSTDKAKSMMDKYAETAGLTDLKNYKVTKYSSDGELTYEYTDENGDTQEKTVKADEMASVLAEAEASEKLNEALEHMSATIQNLDVNSSSHVGNQAAIDFLSSGDFSKSTRKEMNAVAADIEAAGSAEDYLDKIYGGSDGSLSDEEAKSFGYESADAMVEAFEEKQDEIKDEWEKITIPESSLSSINDLSLEAAKNIQKNFDQISLGPAGEEAGQAYLDGLNKMTKDLNLEDQQAAMDELGKINWTDYDAIEQADAIMKKYGVDIDTTSGEWKEFADKMRTAAGAIPDFSKLKSTLNSISGILQKLDFGKVIDEKDYEQLIAYNDEWEKFFQLQADGTRVFIGNSADMTNELQNDIRAQREALQERQATQEAFKNESWGHSEGEDDDEHWVLADWKNKSGEDIDTAKNLLESTGGTEEMLKQLGYTDKAIQDMITKAESGQEDLVEEGTKELREMYRRIGEFQDEELEGQDKDFDEMLASTAQNLDELLDLQDEISSTAYDKQLSVLASKASSLEELQRIQQAAIDNSDSAEKGDKVGLDSYEYGQALLSLSEKYEICKDQADKYNEALLTGDKAQIEAAQSALELSVKIGELSEKYSLDAQTTENYAERLARSFKNAGLSEEAAAKASVTAAVANQRLDRGLSDLNDNLEDYKTKLKKSNRGTAEWSETLDSLKINLADILNMDTTTLTDQFAETALESEDLKLALDGDTEAIERLQSEAAEKMILSIKTNLEGADLEQFTTQWDYLKAHMQETIESPGVDQSALIASFNEMIAAGNMTKEQIESALAGLHVSANIKTEYVQQKMTVPTTITEEHMEVSDWVDYEYPKMDGSGTEKRKVPVYKKYTNTYDGEPHEVTGYVPKYTIDGTSDEGGITTAFVSTPTPRISYSSTTSGKDAANSKSSDSSSDTKTTTASSHEHEVNRYSDEENAINGLSKQYERLGKAKDQAFGAGVLQAMELELKKLKELKNASSNYLEAIVGNGNAEKVAKTLYSGGSVGSLISSGQLGGTIASDYRSLFSGASASGKNVEYTAKDSAGNEWLASTSYNINDIQSMFGSSINFQLDSYGNITNKDSILNELQRLTNQENDNFSSYADPDAVSTTEHNKRLAYLEEIKSRIEQYGTTVEDLSTQADAYLDYISQIQEKNAEIISTKLNNGITLSNNTLTRLERAIKILGDDIYKSTEKMVSWFDIKLKSNRNEYQEQAKLNTDAMSDIQEKVKLYQENPLDENAISPTKAAELAQGIEENYASLYEKAISDITEMEEQYGNTLDTWKEKISEVTTSIDFNIEKLSHLRKVFELLGKKADYEKLGYFLEQQAAGAETRYQVSKKEADKARQLYSKHEAYANTLNNKEREQYEKDVLAKDRELLQEWEKEEQSNFQSWIEALQEVHDNNINKIYQQFEDNLTGEYGSFSSLDASMQRQKAITDEYLTKTNQLYETNKMLRNLQKDIDKTDNRMAKERLKAFSNEINSMKEKEKLTKTDLELAKSKYEILKAQIALEEAQNAKSTVRLQRDNEGNYGYVYTADQDKIADAEQNLADKENAYYNLALQQANDFSQKLAQIGQEYSEARKKLEQERDEGLISETQYQQSLIELQDYYKDLELRYLEGYNTAAGILDEEAAQGRIEAWGTGYEGILNEQRLFNNESTGAAQELNSNLQTEIQNWKDTQQALLQEAGLDNENYKQTVNDVTKEIKTLGDQITKDGGLVDQFEDAASITEKLTRDFINQYEALLNEANGYLEAANNANQYCNELMQLTNQQLQYNAAVAAQPSAVYSGNSAGGYSNNSTGDSSNVDNRTTTGDSFDDTPSSSSSSKKSKGEQYYRVEDTSGYWFYIPESQISWYKQRSNQYHITKLKSGGYTGKWISGKTGLYTGSWDGPDLEDNGKLAFLHQKELVLNATDTENMLNAIKLIRQISQTIDLQAATQSSALSLQAAQFSNNGQVLQQEVTIHAEFPNATNHNEIEEAFNNLVNRASQFASRQ